MADLRSALGYMLSVGALAWSTVLPLGASAGTVIVFGPETFIRSAGPPTPVARVFSASSSLPPYLLRVRNGAGGQCPPASSGEIKLNGTVVLRPSDLNPHATLIDKPVTLQADNTLTVELRSGPGRCLSVEVIGQAGSQDHTPPHITASVAPPPNAEGWQRTNVTITFTCSDAESGVATCPAPLVVTTEGAGQVVSGTAIDNAGNSASASVTLDIDKTPPALTATSSPSPNAAGWQRTDGVVSFACADALSGVSACPPAATVTTEGAGQVVSGTASDRAGNSASASVTLNIDKTPPALTATSSPSPNAAGWNNTDVTVGFTCNDALSGVTTCPASQLVATEGEGQLVDATVADRAGNTATTTVAVSLDKTPPEITAVRDPLPDANGWSNTDVTVSFQCLDVFLAACSPAVTLTTDGADQPASGSAADLAGNSAVASLTVSLDKTPPLLHARVSPPPNDAGWNRTDVTVTFDAADTVSGLASVSPPVTLSDETTGQTVEGTATDVAGNTATAAAAVRIDKTPPAVTITAPADGTVRRTDHVEVTGVVADSNGVRALSVAGASVPPVSPFTRDVPLTEGPHTLAVTARDVADNEGAASVGVIYARPPVVRITSPADLTAIGTTPITVSGEVDDPQATVVVGVAQVPALVSGTTFTATGVPLREGGNVVTAVATNARGDSGTDSITVALDTTPPSVTIASPAGGSVTRSPVVTVAGSVNDIVNGTVNAAQASVTVNGRPAQVAQRSFVARDVPLMPGVNTLTAVARDAVGNMATAVVNVSLDTSSAPRITAVAGNGQQAGIGELLPDPLVVAVTDADGAPLSGRSVVFRVTENNGLVSGGGPGAPGLIVTTDALGRASVRYTLGSRAGVGNNRVEATAPGITGAAAFEASADPHPPARVSLDSGNSQKGVVGRPLPRPFVVVVTDEGHNRLEGVPVTFNALKGGGSFNGADAVTLPSDADGRALAVLNLGPAAGIENNVVEARVGTLSTIPVGFVASGLEPGDPGATRIRGLVLDNTNAPIPGVTLRVRGTALATATDAQGQFALSGAPVGDVHLDVDGSTAQRPGTWPSLEYELVTVPGAENTLGMPVYLVALDTSQSIFVDETHGGTLTLPDYPGFSLTVAPHSALFPDGTRRGTISVTPVHVDKVPMVPNFGQQPRFIVTIQPPGVRFDPPAQVTHPNVDALARGEKTELYSFDHDMGSFVATGTATVSADGTVLRSDPGTGVVKGGWHCGGNPSTTGTAANCATCSRCNGTTCVDDNSQTPPQSSITDCQRQVCSNGGVVNLPDDTESCGDGHVCHEGRCDELQVKIVWRGVEVNESKAIFIRQGTAYYSGSNLRASVTAPDGTFEWAIADTSVASLDPADGPTTKVKGLAPGDTTVTLTYELRGQRVSATARLRVFFPFILSHGLVSDPGTWDDLIESLSSKHMMGVIDREGATQCQAEQPGDLDFCAIRYQDNEGDFIPQGFELANTVARVKQTTGASKLMLVGHSMGGLASRAFMEHAASSDVDRLITIGTPHRGSPLAELGASPLLMILSQILPRAPRLNSPAVNALKPSSLSLRILNMDQLGNLAGPPTTNHVSLIGKASFGQSLGAAAVYDAVTAFVCSRITTLPDCVILGSRAAEFNVFFFNSDLVVGVESQTLRSVAPFFVAEKGVPGVTHLGETEQVGVILRQLGLD